MSVRRGALVAVLLAVLAIIGGAIAWRSSRRSPPASPDTSSTSAAQPARPAQPALAMRLELAAMTDTSAAVTVRLFNATMRQRRSVSKEWKGAIAGAADRPIDLSVPRSTWAQAVSFEVVAGNETVSRVPDGAVSLASPPQSDTMTLGASEVQRIGFAIAAASLPAGSRLRARFAAGPLRAASNTVVIPARPEGGSALVQSARLAVIRRQFDEAERIARSLVQKSPESPQGHYYLGMALEGRGDRAGALAAYEAALARVSGGLEPPIGLLGRVSRLRAK